MAKRKRNIQILFCVSPEEKKLIRRKMIESKTKNMGAYLRKMAIDGYIVNTDTTPLKKQYEEMHKIGVNINQIAKKVNSTGDLYPEEKQELKEMVKELWRIAENGYDLSINKYKEIEYVPVEYPSTQEIMTELHEIEMKIGEEMQALEELLGLK